MTAGPDARKPFDLDGLVARTRSGPCFICELVAGNPDCAHHIIAEDEETILFLSKYPTQIGYALVCPKAHVEDLAEDLDEAAYLRLQAKVHRLARAIKMVMPVERTYVLSLGSQQGNRMFISMSSRYRRAWLMRNSSIMR